MGLSTWNISGPSRLARKTAYPTPTPAAKDSVVETIDAVAPATGEFVLPFKAEANPTDIRAGPVIRDILASLVRRARGATRVVREPAKLRSSAPGESHFKRNGRCNDRLWVVDRRSLLL